MVIESTVNVAFYMHVPRFCHALVGMPILFYLAR